MALPVSRNWSFLTLARSCHFSPEYGTLSTMFVSFSVEALTVTRAYQVAHYLCYFSSTFQTFYRHNYVPHIPNIQGFLFGEGVIAIAYVA